MQIYSGANLGQLSPIIIVQACKNFNAYFWQILGSYVADILLRNIYQK